jgi:threonine/homoserine/homoserine lactone efflux protein
MFYLAAFPQFIPLGEGAVLTAFVLVCVHALINVVWFSVMIVLFARVMRAARSGRFQRWLKAVTGIVFVAFGAKLAALNP